MYLFFINIAVLSILTTLSVAPINYRKKSISARFLTVLGISYLCFLSMCRGISVGNDTYEYAVYFSRIAEQNHILSYIKEARFEPGYVLLNWAVSRFTSDYQVFFALTSLFTYCSVGRFFLHHSRYPVVSIYFFFTLLSFDFFLCAIRQELAIAILLFAYDEMCDRRPLRYVALVLVAGMFHYTALLYLLVYMLISVKSRKKYIALLFLVTAALSIGFRTALMLVLKVFPAYGSYLSGSYLESDIKSSVVLYFAVYAYFIFAGERIGEIRHPERSAADELDWKLVWLLPAVCLISFNAPIVTRFLRYFQLHILTYFPNALDRKAEPERWVLLYITMLATAVYALTVHLLRTPAWYSTYPYQFFWNS